MKFDIARLLNRISLYMDSIHNRNDLAINDIHHGLCEMFPRYNEIINKIFEIKSDVENDIIVLGEKLNEKNWWIISSMITPILATGIETGLNEEELDKTIVDYFKSNNNQYLWEMQERWSELDVEDEILDAFDQILTAHVNCLFYLTTPSAIPLFERLMLQVYETLRRGEEKTHRMNKMLKMITKKVSEDRIYNLSFLSFLKFYESGNMNELSDYNRNKISHGHTLGYCTEVISLKIILAFDELIRFQNFVNEAGDLFFSNEIELNEKADA